VENPPQIQNRASVMGENGKCNFKSYYITVYFIYNLFIIHYLIAR